MKTTFLILLGLISFNTLAGTPDNFCSPDVDSKRYITSDFSLNYPRKAVFECIYNCRAKGKTERVHAVSTVTVHSMDEDASMVVCQGVLVKKVPWGYDFDRIEPFYAYDSSMNEIKRFAFENIDRKNETEVIYLNNLKKNLNEVVVGYARSGNQQFIEAAGVLYNIADELPAKTTLLDRHIKMLIEARGNVPFAATVQSLVLMQIKTHAAWRIPSHNF